MILVISVKEIFLVDAKDLVLPPTLAEQQFSRITNVLENRSSDADRVKFRDIEGPKRNVVDWVMQEPVVILVLVVSKVTRKERLAFSSFREVQLFEIADCDVDNTLRRYRQLKHVDIFCVEEPYLHVSLLEFFFWVIAVVHKAVLQMLLLPIWRVLVSGHMSDLQLEV